MDARLSIDPAGNLTLLIAGSDGELPYAVEFVPPGLDDWAVKLHGGSGPYRVAKGPRGHWRCSCPAFRWRQHCKHVKACRPVHAFVARLMDGVTPHVHDHPQEEAVR